MKKIIEYKIFISSPSDLGDERAIVEKTVSNYNRYDNIKLTPVLWEESMPVSSGVSPQEMINNELLGNSDLLIALFGSKFGSPTDNYESGTVEEIEQFIISGKKVVLYFITDKDKRNPSDLTPKDLSELTKIAQFKERYSSGNIYKSIKASELKDQLIKDLNYHVSIFKKSSEYKSGVMDKSKNIIETEQVDLADKSEYKGNWWADDSIAAFINEFLIEKGLGEKYLPDLTFYENTQLIKDCGIFTESTIINILNQAKAYAFNKKYGNYDYSNDLRKKYPKWSQKVKAKIDELLDGQTTNKNILGIGSNYGIELQEIFGDESKNSFTILDISKDAISRGKKQFTYEFIEADMETVYPTTKKFDICLCLRTIQSRGAFRQNVIIQMHKALNSGGIILVSIPNGYVDINNDNKAIKGLYDHRSKLVQERRPQTLANKILNKLQDYNYDNTGIETLETEILIWGKKHD